MQSMSVCDLCQYFSITSTRHAEHATACINEVNVKLILIFQRFEQGKAVKGELKKKHGKITDVSAGCITIIILYIDCLI